MDQPKTKPVEYIELLIELTNTWRFNLVERTASLRQGEMQKSLEPTAVLMTQTGQPIGIGDVVKGRKRLVREARQYVVVLEEMLKAEQDGKLEDCWNDDALAAVPKLTMGVCEVVWCSVKKKLSQGPSLLVTIDFSRKFDNSFHWKCAKMSEKCPKSDHETFAQSQTLREHTGRALGA